MLVGGSTTPRVTHKQYVKALVVDDRQHDNPCYLCWAVGPIAEAYSVCWACAMSTRWERKHHPWYMVEDPISF